MKRSALFLLGILLGLSGLAQNEVDALRYSQIHFGGTARYNALAGAFGALGGDFSTLSVNPAGIGVYRKSELTLSTGIVGLNTSANHFGTSSDDSKLNVNIGNFGWVNTYNSKSTTGWVAGSFGIGYNRLANFHSQVNIVGTNESSSLLDVYQNRAQGVDFLDLEDVGGPYAFDAGLAWLTFLIDTAGGRTNYITQIPGYGQVQNNTIETSGRVGETVFSFGGNYENRLYVGGTFGLTAVRYQRESTYREIVATGDSTTLLETFTLNDNLNTRGNGYNLKLGAIYRVNDYVRVGGYVHTPTWLVLEDTWNTRIEANYTGFDPSTANSPDGEFDYRLRTPYRLGGSFAAIFNKSGLLSADVEFVDYAFARLRSRFAGNYNFDVENEEIQNSYQSAVNVRVGTEWRLKPWMLRAGVAYYGSPYQSSVQSEGDMYSYSVGAGYRDKSFFIDFAYVLTQEEEDFFLYDANLISATTLENTQQRVVLTFGVRY